jgi:hypothetical protein
VFLFSLAYSSSSSSSSPRLRFSDLLTVCVSLHTYLSFPNAISFTPPVPVIAACRGTRHARKAESMRRVFCCLVILDPGRKPHLGLSLVIRISCPSRPRPARFDGRLDQDGELERRVVSVSPPTCIFSFLCLPWSMIPIDPSSILFSCDVKLALDDLS